MIFSLLTDRLTGGGRKLLIAPTLMTAALLSQSVKAEEAEMQTNHPYVGLWVTEDSYIRHELLPNGRYVEARGTRERAYEGRYQVRGISIIGTIPALQRMEILSTAFCITAA